MTHKVRVGIVGTSWWADMMYLPALQSHPQAELAAICGRNRNRAEEMASKYAIPGVFIDYREMIERGGLDALVVAVPDDLHYEITIKALDAGLHVLCEKPLALKAQEAREMYEKAEVSKVKHMVFFTNRWLPFFRYLRDLIDEGYIGRCYHCEFRQMMGSGRNQEYAWRLDRKRANGILGDLGSHMIDLAHWLVGDITQVSARLGVFVDRPGADGGLIDPANDSALLLAEFANGAHGLIQASTVAHLADRRMQQQVNLYGQAGTLELNISYWGSEAGAVIRAARSQDKQFQALEVPASYWGDVNRSDPFGVFTKQSAGSRLFIDAILDNRPITPNFYDGYKVQQVIEAAIASHESGCAATVEIHL